MAGMCKNSDCGVKKSKGDTSNEVTPEQYLEHCKGCPYFRGATKNGKDTHTARHR